jgi:hypothetical protein
MTLLRSGAGIVLAFLYREVMFVARNRDHDWMVEECALERIFATLVKDPGLRVWLTLFGKVYLWWSMPAYILHG